MTDAASSPTVSTTERPPRAERPERIDSDRPVRTEGDRPEGAQRANGRIRRDREQPQDEQRIDFAVIPPAIGITAEAPQPEVESEAPAPRRRVRRPRPEGDADITPAA